MPRLEVTIDDERLSVYRVLNDRRMVRDKRGFVVEGRTLVHRLLDSRFETQSILVAEQFAREFEPRLNPSTPLYVVQAADLDEIVGFNFHRGVMACGKRRPLGSLPEVMQRLGQTVTIVVCPNVVDPTNLGGIVRNCAAFGVDALLLGPDCADPFSRRVVRVSMGAALNLTIVESEDLMAAARSLRDQHGFELISTVLSPPAESLITSKRCARTAIVFGNEGPGLDEIWLRASDRRVTLPMESGTDSLNVATASGVFLYHFCHVAPTFATK